MIFHSRDEVMLFLMSLGAAGALSVAVGAVLYIAGVV